MSGNRQTHVLLAGLWTSQWLAPSFLGMGGLATILYQQHVPLERLAVFQALTLIGLARFLWAPLIDRFGSRRSGHYRSWLLVAQPAMALATAGLIALDPVADLTAVTAVVIVMWVLMGVQDIATDALSIRLLDTAGRGVANGVQTAAGFLGTLLGSGAVLLVYDRWGWAPALLTLTAGTLLPLAQILRFKEPPPRSRGRSGFGSLPSLLRTPGVAPWALVLLPLMWAGTGVYFAVLNPMLVDLGWSLTRIGLVVTVLGSLAAIAGGLAAGPITARTGPRRALVLFGVAQAAAVTGLFAPASGNGEPVVVAAVVAAIHLTYAAAVTAVTAVCMELARPASAGGDYTAVTTIGTAVALGTGAAATAAAGALGYPAVLTVSILLLAIGIAATFLWHPEQKAPPSTR
ncbi:MFS transporter [Glycomyces tritici]|uniref:MFS transporter n=1 Tax=Glycomyces tritici TaxID=2665176 RepID=A0ABT7YWW1_9ACTN|nr:MFS transporter [Glycomyces tritici]MDN3243130.1 MFS transporter [Glycomyces tritici]